MKIVFLILIIIVIQVLGTCIAASSFFINDYYRFYKSKGEEISFNELLKESIGFSTIIICFLLWSLIIFLTVFGVLLIDISMYITKKGLKYIYDNYLNNDNKDDENKKNEAE